MKKAQVTIFMIIGIIIIISAGLLIYFQDEIGSILFSEQSIPESMQPVQLYVEQCLSNAAGDAMNLIGSQGGYAVVSDEIFNNPQARLVLFHDFIMPYWYVPHKSEVPQNDFIEEQIALAILPNVERCLDDFSALDDSFSITKEGEVEVDANIHENSVDILLRVPLKVKVDEDTRNINFFKAKVPVRLGRVLRLARQIMEAENEEMFLEKSTIDLMAMLPDDIMPFSNLVFSCPQKVWQVSEVKNTLKDVLKTNLPRMRIGKTDHMPFNEPISAYINPVNPPSDMAEYAMLYWDPLTEDFSDMKAAFSYWPEFGIQFDVSPQSGGIMKSIRQQGGSIANVNMLAYCLQFYHFSYDMTYPVKTTIFDEQSFSNNGYSFSFAFPVVIYHNTGVRSNQPGLQLDLYGSDDFCQDKGSEEYRVMVKDAASFIALEDASVAFQCMKFKCDLGKTEGQYNALYTSLPDSCFGGIITAEKTGYLKGATYVEDNSVEVFMLPLKEVEIEVLKYDNSTGAILPLSDTETAAVYFTLRDADQELYMIYSPGVIEKLPIVDSSVTYDIQIYIYDSNELVGGYTNSWTYDSVSGGKLLLYGAVFPSIDQEDLILKIQQNSNITELRPVIQ